MQNSAEQPEAASAQAIKVDEPLKRQLSNGRMSPSVPEFKQLVKNDSNLSKIVNEQIQNIAFEI